MGWIIEKQIVNLFFEKMTKPTPIEMTLREINIKLEGLYKQLDMIRIYENEMLRREGRKKFQELLDSTLDQIIEYQILKDKLLKK